MKGQKQKKKENGMSAFRLRYATARQVAGMTRYIFVFLFCLLLPFEAQAARRSVADMSEDFVAVTEGFDGAHVTVFGVLRSPADVAIVIEGPPAEAKVRTKTRQFGIWINGEPETFSPVPSYYAVVTSRPIRKMVSEETAVKYGLGTDKLPFVGEGAGQGIVEARKAKGLYQDSEGGVSILDNKLFRADIHFPASVPIGTYKAHVYEFSGGRLLAERTDEMRVAQVGTGARISQMARREPLFYGVLSLVLSLGIGGAAAWAFRKRS